LRYQQWGDAFFVFHSDSGLTHFLNQAAVDILRLVEHEALSNDEIYMRMLVRYAIDDDPDLRESIANVVALLDQLGVLTSIR